MKQLDLKSKCSEGLRAVASSLTSQDKRDAANQLHVHYNTINNYLAGRVSDVEFGLRLLEFFNGVISERLSRVKKILAA